MPEVTVAPPDGGERLGPGIVQAWQKNEDCKALAGDKWAVTDRSRTKSHYICIIKTKPMSPNVYANCTNTHTLKIHNKCDLY